MNRQRITRLVLLLYILAISTAFAEEPSLIRYNTPANNRKEAFPIGNGRMGAMIFAHPLRERILLYERNGSKPGINLKRGELNIIVSSYKTFKNYNRTLNLNAAVASMAYTAPDGTIYGRNYLASMSDSVLVIRMSTNKKETLTCNLTLKASSKRFKVMDGQAMIILAGTTDQADAEGITYRYVTVVRPWVTGGRVGMEKGVFTIRKADEAVIYVASLTVPSTDKRTDLELAEYCAKTVTRAYGKDYSDMSKRHEARYSELFNQVRFEFEGAKNRQIYLDFCTYIWLSNTINATHVLPMQSLWSEQSPAVAHNNTKDDWYRSVETWGLSNLREPLFRNAKTANDAQLLASFSVPPLPGGGITYAGHVWNHYLFTGDKNFLTEHFPFMQSVARNNIEALKSGDEAAKSSISTLFSYVIEATEVVNAENRRRRNNPDKAFADSLKKHLNPNATVTKNEAQPIPLKLNEGTLTSSTGDYVDFLNIPSQLADCLLQSRDGYIFVLPSLPENWTDGSVSGLKARGGFDVSFSWKAGRLNSLTIRSLLGGVCRIRSTASLQGAGVKPVKGPVKNPLLGSEGNGFDIPADGTQLVEFPTQAGATYRLTVL